MKHSELRKDYIQDKYVIIAPRRGKRPHDVRADDVDPVRSLARAKGAGPKDLGEATSNGACVFCPSRLPAKEIIAAVPNRRQWQIAVAANKYAAVSVTNPRAFGVQEVVIETPDHEPELEDLSDAHVAQLLAVYADRTRVISRNKRIEYLLIFKNNGGRAGASLAHSHSQIFATGFIPPNLFDKSQRVQEHKLKHGTCVYCDVIKKERGGPRWIAEDRHVVAFCPYASMHNHEVWILPKRHIDNVTLLTAQERLAWAKALKRILKKIVHELKLPYNYYFHQVIRDEDQHLYMKITPRGSVWAGVEIGSGIIINPIPPEDAAAFYRRSLTNNESFTNSRIVTPSFSPLR